MLNKSKTNTTDNSKTIGELKAENFNVEKGLKAKKIKAKIQKMGSFLAGMIMPAIGVLIAWGLWTAMFLYDYDNNKAQGWFNVPALGRLVEPGIKYLLPILISFNGGRMIYGIRGGMISTFVILCAIVGTDHIYGNWIFMSDGLHPGSPNQFIGAMVLGPISALILKYVEKLYMDKINSGFEMFVKNFGIGIYGILIGLVAFYGWGWIMWGITWTMMHIISLFGDNKWVAPLLGIFTEPVKVSFLNNALNHGVLGPIGYTQVSQMQESGMDHPRSIFFMYDPNPGPGLGMLIGYMLFTKKESRTNAMGASIIHTIGGIHEVYFVFILAKPKMVLSTITGVVAAQFITSYMGGGTVATPSPGSIIAMISLSPGTNALLVNLLSFAVGTGASFGIATIILLADKKRNSDSSDSINIKFSDDGISFDNKNVENEKENNINVKKELIKKIVVACEAGVGSSAMAAGIIRKWVKKNNFEVDVTNIAVKDLTDEYDVVVTMKNFEEFVKQKSNNAEIYTVTQYLGTGIYDDLFSKIEKSHKK